MGGLPTNQLESGKWAKGIQALKQSGATPEEVALRSQRFRSRFGPDIPLHPIVLANNWSLLAQEIPHATHDPHRRNSPHRATTSGPRRSAQPRDWDRIKRDLNAPTQPAAG
jgi:hypothetical protein